MYTVATRTENQTEVPFRKLSMVHVESLELNYKAFKVFFFMASGGEIVKNYATLAEAQTAFEAAEALIDTAQGVV